MTLLSLIVLFVAVGLVLYLITRYIPMEPAIKNLLVIAVVIILVLYLLSATGLLGPLNVPIGRLGERG